MEIEATTISEAHEKTVAKIMRVCREIDIETSPGKWETTWEYPDIFTVIIREPWKEPQVSEPCNFGPGFIAKYKRDLCHLKLRGEYPNGNAPVYTYPWRLMDYPIDNPDKSGLHESMGNGDGRGINQIDQIVKRLLKNPESRRANMITWVPEIDGEAVEDQPCLQSAHFLLRESASNTFVKSDVRFFDLHLRCFFRSHDMLGGAGANWIGLNGLQDLVIRKMIESGYTENIRAGSLTTCSSSAHLYWKRDKDDLDRFKAYLFKKYHMFLEMED